MIRYASIFLLLVSVNKAVCQKELTVGVKAGISFGQRLYVNPTMVDGVLIRSTASGLSGYSVNAFSDVSLAKRMRLYAAIGSTFNVGTTGSMIIVSNELFSNDSFPWLDGISPSFNTFETAIGLRYQLRKFLQVYGGLNLLYLYDFENAPGIWLEEGPDDELYGYEIRRQNYRSILICAIEDSFKKNVLMSSFGLKFTHKGFLLDVNYEFSITPVSETLRFQATN